MSILIRGMEMPKNCGECWLYEVTKDMVSGEVLFLCKCRDVVVNNPYTTKDKGCPLVDDADELVRIWKGAKFYGNIKPIVDARPTVIEAEGSEE